MSRMTTTTPRTAVRPDTLEADRRMREAQGQAREAATCLRDFAAAHGQPHATVTVGFADHVVVPARLIFELLAHTPHGERHTFTPVDPRPMRSRA